ncbi:MAG TPA: tRNA uridine-5-carboxymethylaminomethyl(34) synthesis GTPase MnmE [Crenotrichaceae bacterium]|nr:tRNA uridine-5-carboxymethylaminomethyl(34) synthesis GTPase MnmE [Crenotrichaceae bacterium]
MDDSESDTIAAIATPPGNGGVGVLRISGRSIKHIAQSVLGCLPSPRQAKLLSFLDTDGSALDCGLAIYFPAPHSYTGEDILELQAHGGRVLMALLLKRVTGLGARIAEPGEFTRRAYLNGKLDLVQAEAVIDLINSSNEYAVRSAQRSLSGDFSDKINVLVNQTIELRCQIESSIDFSDEDIDFISELSVDEKIKDLLSSVDAILHSARQGAVLRNGLTVVIAGQPNTGKSTLLNRMAGQNVAIVSDIPGTTRDTLKEQIQIGGIPLHLIDTAGLRETIDPIEQEGVKRAKQSIRDAGYVLMVMDSSQQHKQQNLPTDFDVTGVPVIRIMNKIDLLDSEPKRIENDTEVEIHLSAKTGEGMNLLYDYLQHRVGFETNEDVFLARDRHLQALKKARQVLDSACTGIVTNRAIELLAEDLRQVQIALSQITGEFVADDLLGEIFSRFCIGK